MANTYFVEFTTEYKNLVTDIRNSLQSIANTHQQISNDISTIKNSISSIDSSISDINSSIGTLENRGSNSTLGIVTRPIINEFLSEEQQRALVVSAMKESGVLDEWEAEINNPTDLAGD